MRPHGLTCKDEEELLGARVRVGRGPVAPLEDLDAKGEGHSVGQGVHDEGEAVGLIRQPEARHLTQAPLQRCACKRGAGVMSPAVQHGKLGWSRQTGSRHSNPSQVVRSHDILLHMYLSG